MKPFEIFFSFHFFIFISKNNKKMFEICPINLDSLSLCANDIVEKATKSPENFSTAISSFIHDAEMVNIGVFGIRDVARRYGIQRRRLYDVLLVLEACGVCEKSSVDTIIWKGMKNVYYNIKRIWEKKSLAPISARTTITISELTKTFLVSFFSLNKSTLNIRELAGMLASSANRQKTLLCKLHQIAFILDTAGIIKKTDYCYVTLSSEFSSIGKEPITIQSPVKVITETPSFLSIESLLNHH